MKHDFCCKWNKWTTGECPVPGDTMVFWKIRSRGDSVVGVRRAEDLVWNFRETEGPAITEYLVVPPELPDRWVIHRGSEEAPSDGPMHLLLRGEHVMFTDLPKQMRWTHEDSEGDIIGWRPFVEQAQEPPRPPACPHADLMAEYAKDAATHIRPWLLWQYRHQGDAVWDNCPMHPGWSEGCEYRRKPSVPVHTVNGFVVPAPQTAEIQNGVRYWVPSPASDSWTFRDNWSSYPEDLRRLERGLVFLEEEHAIANAKAMVGIDPEWSQA